MVYTKEKSQNSFALANAYPNLNVMLMGSLEVLKAQFQDLVKEKWNFS